VQALIGGEGNAAPWTIYAGVAVDLFSDGVMIGTGSTIGLALGLLLALGQVPADVPEGFATIANFKRRGIGRSARLLLSASFALPIFLGATIGYWAMRGQPELLKLAFLAFTAGGAQYSGGRGNRPRGAPREGARLAALVFVGGFALFALLSTYFE
jgi:zinc transporter, ZIP family